MAPGGNQLVVMISGGFAAAYSAVVAQFERTEAIAVTTLSGASQGSSCQTIRAQLADGAQVDLVILSQEGLAELTRDDVVREGSEVELATAVLGLAVREGTVCPNLETVEDVAHALRRAKLVATPQSTSGIFFQHEILPRLGIAGSVCCKALPRGSDCVAALLREEADLVVAPVSELSGIGGVSIAGVLPPELQLVQTFTSAILMGARHCAAAQRLQAFLASDPVRDVIRRTGMQPCGGSSRAGVRAAPPLSLPDTAM